MRPKLMTDQAIATPAELLRRLKGVEGWLAGQEAWTLYQNALTVPAANRIPLIVDVGSYMGRSAIAMGLALKVRGGGRLVTIDPQSPERHLRLTENMRDRGVDDVVEAWRMGSVGAAQKFEPGTVDMVFIDADHRFESVLQDMIVWRPALADGAVVAFNDPFWKGVNRFLREYVFVLSSPFRDPNLVENTLFLAYRPNQDLTRLEVELFPLMRTFLKRGRLRHVLDRRSGRRGRLPDRFRDLGVGLDARRFPRLAVKAEAAAKRAHEARMRDRARH
ncbi:MAG: class I SAM-dependent methyltransferase [Actinomycetota bacterium]